jgi:hypothetical protein
MLRVVKSKKCEITGEPNFNKTYFFFLASRYLSKKCELTGEPNFKKNIFFLVSFMLRVVNSKKCEIPCWNAMGPFLIKKYIYSNFMLRVVESTKC